MQNKINAKGIKISIQLKYHTHLYRGQIFENLISFAKIWHQSTHN